MINTDSWFGCYKKGWNGKIVPEAFAHPAKVSYGLAERIYKHVLDENWLQSGDCVVDPFGGIGGFAFHAMLNGINFVGVELESRFVDLGNQNIAAWNKRYGGKLPRWGSARLVQGDSRELGKIVAGAGACVSSPPYANQSNIAGDQAAAPGMNWNNVKPSKTRQGAPPNAKWYYGKDYGSTPGNLGNMPAGDFAAAIGSPPFTGVTATQDPNFLTPGEQGKIIPSKSNLSDYGTSPGQLGAMPPGDYSAAISSPPWEKTNAVNDPEYQIGRKNGGGPLYGDYGNTAGQLGANSGDTFWTSARLIVDQVYSVLKPGGVAIWVVKAYVKNKAIVPFPDQWREMCEAAGFVTLHEHRAWLVEQRGTQYDLEGGSHTKQVERKSFFRRLAESKGSPRIDFETVLCMRKP